LPFVERMKTILYPIITFLVVLLVWHTAAARGPWPDYLFPGPVEVANSLWKLLDWPHVLSGPLGTSLIVTLRRLFLGFFLSVILGGALGFVMARFNGARKALKPFLLGLQSLPSLAWVPLAILWYGLGDSALVFITVIGSLFAAALLFTDAMASVNPRQIMAARNMGARGVGLVVTVAVPAALPAILSGFKQTWSFAWRSLIGAEIVFASVGLGFLLNQGRDFLDVPQIFAVMVATLAVGLLFEVLVFANLEKWMRRRYGL
jgi:NitT/TauT family transport system permease protein